MEKTVRRKYTHEFKQLKREKQRLRMEREILKKATAFFAKESFEIFIHQYQVEGVSV